MRCFALRLSCLIVLVSLLGCGGGSKGGGSSSSGNPTIFSSVQTIGSAGGNVANDDGTVSVVVPAGTLADGSTVVLEEQRNPIAGITPLTASGLPHAVTVSLDPTAMADGSAIQIDVPQLQPYNQVGTSVFAFTTTDNLTPLATSLDAATGKVVAILPKTTVQTLASGGRSARRGFTITIDFALSSILGKELPASGQMLLYDAGSKTFKTPTVPMQGRVAVLVHGIMNSISDMADTAGFLTSLTDGKGDSKGNAIYTQIWGYNYEWRAHIDKSGDAFATDLRAKMISGTQVDLYGHSMGGLVCRWALEKDGLGADIHKLVTLGTPHDGVPLGGLQLLVNVVLSKSHPEDALAGVEDLVVPLVDPFHTAFISRLNSGDSPYKAIDDYCTLAGTSYASYYPPLGKLVNALYLNNDGIVPLSSALSSVLASKSSAWSNAVTHTATVALDHAQLNGDPDDVLQSTMTTAVRPFILASLTGAVK